MAANDCRMKVNRFASLTSTRVGRFARLLEGGVDNTMGIDIAKLTKPNVLNVQAAPIFASIARAAGAYVRPPSPAADKMNPIAEPLWVSKYSGATARTGKYNNEVPIP